jgi:8-oxo-(d)GTP phosphatase
VKLFINNKRIKLISKTESIKNSDFDIFLTAMEHVDLNKIHGNVLITNANNDDIIAFLKVLELKKLVDVKSFSFLTDDVIDTEKRIKKQFKVIKAAGGVVIKDNKILLIFRLGMWDFPKGKLEGNETAESGALREVEEECGIKVEAIDRICSTWHSYTDKSNKILKKTSWYLMRCLDDSKLAPQIEEQIEKIEWMTLHEANQALEGSYESIRYVLKRFNKLFSDEFAS